jgi:3-deoxy-D-manno-octulosonate 8-phosphate phosphatase (KDO 8-P phosphatase)
MQPPSLRERCTPVELLVLDVDGVLTDGGIVYTAGGPDGQALGEVKQFHVRDGSGLKLWHLAGRRSALLTGRTSPLVDLRAGELGVTFVRQGSADKLAGYQELLRQAGVEAGATCYVGDDVPDVPVLGRCGLAVAVADACAEARAAAHYITRTPGGRGAVREVIELILRCQGRWSGG